MPTLTARAEGACGVRVPSSCRMFRFSRPTEGIRGVCRMEGDGEISLSQSDQAMWYPSRGSFGERNRNRIMLVRRIGAEWRATRRE